MHPEIRNQYRKSVAILLAATLQTITACQPGPPIQATPVQSQTLEMSVNPALATTQPEATGPGREAGLSFEEFRSTTPPPPVDLRVSAGIEGVRLDWIPAPEVEITHFYSDVVIRYNIYRRVEGEPIPRLLITVTELHYIDTSVEKGTQYYYAVSAVHEGPVEGERTDEAACSFP